MTRKQCKACDVFFIAFRSDALTCSPKCRQRYKRMCDKITAEMAARGFVEKLDGGEGNDGPKVVQCLSCGITRPSGYHCPVCLDHRSRLIPSTD